MKQIIGRVTSLSNENDGELEVIEEYFESQIKIKKNINNDNSCFCGIIELTVCKE